jgi:hypothetical protein
MISVVECHFVPSYVGCNGRLKKKNFIGPQKHHQKTHAMIHSLVHLQTSLIGGENV